MNIQLCNHFLLFLSLVIFLSSYCGCVPSGITAINGSNNNTIKCIEHERLALLKFKQGIEADKCGLLSSWDDHEDNRNCCEWHGVGCSSITGHIITFNLRGMTESRYCYLEGKVSSSLANLKHLHRLDLSNNDFSFEHIPSFIGSIVNLKYLNLSYSGFVEDIPEQLGNLSTLTSLDLSYNPGLYVKNLSWLSRLTMLRTIKLSEVALREATSWLHTVNNLPFLRVLDLGYCFLPQPIIGSPLSYQNSSTTISFLNLAANEFNDSSIVFEWLFNLSGIHTHLTHLDLSINHLEGQLPNALGDLHDLSYLDLSYNYFQGNIPTSFGNMHSLSYLSLGVNNFQSFPKTLGNLCNLQELHFFSNNITDELSNLIIPLTRCASKSSLRTLYLSGNQLNGTIPRSFGQMSRMEDLDLSYNCLKGSLSDIHFSNLSRLKYLDLSDNYELALNMSVVWVPPFQLDYIGLTSCKLGPLFPKWILSQTNYFYLDISNAGISDTIPESFWMSLNSKLSLLNLSHNNIHGSLPISLSKLQFSFIGIDVSFNNFEGAIPSIPSNVSKLFLNNNRFSNSTSFLCPRVNKILFILDLSNNYLSGVLLDCWMRFPRLEILHLDNNNFSGVIPPSIGYLENLQSLHLRNNNFSRRLPSSLENLISLVILDLGYNSFSGHIPPSIGNIFWNLSFLSLRSNNFEGELPLSFCHMSFLQILDLSSNKITGTIPKCIHSLTSMQNGTDLMPILEWQVDKVENSSFQDVGTISWKRKEWSFRDNLGLYKAIDLSKNKLQGEIPMEFSFLKGLGSLNLSQNNLTGSITPQLGQLAALNSLDLSRNRLLGGIPSSFAELNSLGILDLSNNQLSGEIPNIPQLQRFNESSYIGNPRLCGLPLPKCPWDQPHDNNTSKEDNAKHQDKNDSHDNVFIVGLYISVVLGFIIGFWGVCGTLVLKRSWRYAFFKFLDDTRDKLNDMVSTNQGRTCLDARQVT